MNSQADELTTRVGRILIQYADRPDLLETGLPPSIPVFGPGGVITDSLQVLDALCDIEAQLGIDVPDEDLTEELFASIESLVSYLSARLVVADRA